MSQWLKVFVSENVRTITCGVFFFAIFSIVARRGYRWTKDQERLSNAFRLYKLAEELAFSDVGFRESQPGDDTCTNPRSHERPFFSEYFPRKAAEDAEPGTIDAEIAKEFTEDGLEQYLRDGQGKGFLLLDLFGAGKTMTVFQILRRMSGFVIVTPNSSVPDKETLALLRGRKVVVFLDDIANLADDNYDIHDFLLKLKHATSGQYAIAAICRKGGDFTKLAEKHGSYIQRFCEEGLLKLRLLPMPKQSRLQLARTAGMVLDSKDERKFPLPGDIAMWNRNAIMMNRFRNLRDSATRDVLLALKFLDSVGIGITWHRLALTIDEVLSHHITPESLESRVTDLWNASFLLEHPSANSIIPHPGYLDRCVSYLGAGESEDERWEDEHWGKLNQSLENARDVDAMMELCQGHRFRKDLSRALLTLDSVLRVDPQHADAHFRRGYALARTRKYNEALEANTRALELREDFPEALNCRGYILSNLGKWTDAEAALRLALKHSPNYDDARTNLAIVLARTNRVQEAIQEIRTALGIRQENYYAFLNLGINLSRENHLDEALRAYAEALRIRPNYPEAYFNRGITLAKSGRYVDALAAHDEAIRQRNDYAEAHMHRGETLYHLGRYQEAIEAHSRAIDLRNDYALAYVNRGLTYAHMGKECVEQANKDGQAALAFGTVPLHSVLSIAKSLGVNGALSEALAMIDDIIDAAPDFPEAHLERGITLTHLDRGPEALSEFDRASKLGLDTPELHSNWGLTLAFLKKFADAYIAQTRAIELEPDNALAHANRGLTSACSGHLEAALADFDRALELDRGNAKFHLNRAITLARRRSFDEAVADYEQAIGLDPNYAKAFYEYAKTLCFLSSVPGRDQPSILGHAIKLLEAAVAIDISIIYQINHELHNFRVLKYSPVYGLRFTALVSKPLSS